MLQLAAAAAAAVAELLGASIELLVDDFNEAAVDDYDDDDNDVFLTLNQVAYLICSCVDIISVQLIDFCFATSVLLLSSSSFSS